jgi:hypothetical protein
MPDDPFIVVNNVVLDNRRDRRFDENWIRWIALLVLCVGSLCWTLFRVDLGREPVLPDRPLTKADIPLVEKKIKFLKADAEMAGKFFPHLSNKAEIQEASKAWEEVYYTPEVFLPAAKLHRLQNARISELRPELAEHLQVREQYEEARYGIANDPTITDKAAAIADLKKRLGPELKATENSKTAAQVKAAVAYFVGDPELDAARQEYHGACEKAILNRHPDLAAFYHDVDNQEEAYHHFMAQAYDLSRKIDALEGKPVRTAVASIVPKPAASIPSKASNPDAPSPPPLPKAAVGYGVKVGDTVDIAALNPPIALHNATLTAMNNDQLTVRSRADVFVVRWDDLTRLKAQSRN